MAKCFYHNDLDGKCAGFWVYRNYDVEKHRECEMIPIDYRDSFPLDSIKEGEAIFIVDYSIQPHEMRQLLEITKNVTWIDHHKTAIEKYKDFEHDIPGLRVDGVAGCVLTYLYFNVLQKGKKKFDLSLLPKVPMFTRLIGDRDIWAWAFGQRTQNFCEGLLVADTNPTSDIWDHVWIDTKDVEVAGEIVSAYKKVHNKELIDAFAYPVEFEGYRGIACNVGKCSSQLFDSLDKQYDLMVPFIYDGEQFTVSIYSTTVDVSEIAKKYGGGGHKGAAGFQCKELPFRMVKE